MMREWKPLNNQSFLNWNYYYYYYSLLFLTEKANQQWEAHHWVQYRQNHYKWPQCSILLLFRWFFGFVFLSASDEKYSLICGISERKTASLITCWLLMSCGDSLPAPDNNPVRIDREKIDSNTHRQVCWNRHDGNYHELGSYFNLIKTQCIVSN